MEPTPTPAPAPAPGPAPAEEDGGQLAAVLIGIDEYKEVGIPNLAGARSDICAWWRMLVERLGVAGADITVLHGGPLTPAELAGPRRVGESPHAHALRLDAALQSVLVEATAQRAEQAIQRVRSQLGADARLLIVFSGHGTATTAPSELLPLRGTPAVLDELGLVFPEAVPDNGEVATGTAGVLPLPALRGAPAAAVPGGLREENVTVVVDACFGRPVLETVRWGRTVGLQTLPDLQLGAAHAGPGVTIHSCGAAELASEVRLDGVGRGAFTAALLFSTDQWSIGDQSGGGSYVRAEIGELVQRAARHLALWGIRQTPVIGGTDASARPLLLGGAPTSPPAAAPRPDRRRDGRQIIVETLIDTGGFEFDDKNGLEVLRTAVTGDYTGAVGGLSLAPHQEYWRMVPPAVMRLVALMSSGLVEDLTISRTTQVHVGGSSSWIHDKLLSGGPALKRLQRTAGLNWKTVDSVLLPERMRLKNASALNRRALLHWWDEGLPKQGQVRRALQIRWNPSGQLVALYFLSDQPIQPKVGFFRHFVQNPGSTLSARLVSDGGALPQAIHKWWVSMQSLKPV